MATLILEHSDNARSDRLGTLLRDHGHRLRVLRPHHGDAVPTSLHDIDALIALGGPASPLDDSVPYIEPVMALMRAAHKAEVPVVGVCLGCQLLARALGGTVERNEAGAECGWHSLRLSATGREDPLYAGIPWQSVQFHSHSFQVTKLPEGGRTLASSQQTPIQAFAVGVRSYAVQYHPECFRETIDRLVDHDAEHFAAAGTTVAAVHEQTKVHYADYDRLSQRFFESVALCLMPIDRRFAGIAKDLHH